MKDVQNQRDDRNIYLNQVGIRELKYPIEIKDSKGEWIPITATIKLCADLDPTHKGTHMSRFVEVLQDYRQMELKKIRQLLQSIKDKLDAKNSFITIEFDYFIMKTSPVTKRTSPLAVNVRYDAALIEDKLTFELTVHTPVTTLCPCSKEISDYSAHNQRAIVSITTRSKTFIPIEKLVDIAERASSSPVYTMLKRPDEKYVTEYAYDHPKFVEDVARDVKLLLDDIEHVQSYAIEVESQESIHNHAAYARVEGQYE